MRDFRAFLQGHGLACISALYFGTDGGGIIDLINAQGDRVRFAFSDDDFATVADALEGAARVFRQGGNDDHT